MISAAPEVLPDGGITVMISFFFFLLWHDFLFPITADRLRCRSGDGAEAALLRQLYYILFSQRKNLKKYYRFRILKKFCLTGRESGSVCNAIKTRLSQSQRL